MNRTRFAYTAAVATTAVYVAFGLLYLTPLTPAGVSHDAGGVSVAFFVLPLVAFALVGGLVAAKRPENPVGWLVLAAAALLGVGALTSLVGSLLIHAGNPAGPWIALGGLLIGNGVTPTTACFVLAVLVFPDGRMRSRLWRAVGAGEVLLAVVALAFGAVNPAPGALGIGYAGSPDVNATSPLAVPGAEGAVDAFTAITTPMYYALALLAFVSVFLRLRGADAERRLQIKWFGAGAAVSLVCNEITNFLPAPTNAAPALLAVISALALAAGVALPGAVAVAVLKHRLYDIDLVISRTLVYGSLAVFITAVYVGIAVGIGALIGGGGKPNLVLSIVATAIVAVGFQPARERVQHVANRLVYGTRATPYEVLSQFSARVAESYAVDDVTLRMARVLAEGTGAQRADVWLRNGTVWREAAVWPAGAEPAESIPALDGTLPSIPGASRLIEVRHQGTILGALGVTKRSGESLTPVEEHLLMDLAGQAGLVLRNVGLTADLQARLDELRASRQRLVTAQDQERRRLERNLHDGAQQHLVAIKVKLGLAEMLLARDPVRAQQTLDQLKSDADEALETLRDLARGIYPPLLADKGLRVALESQARKATVPVTIEADGIGRYPQDIEAAVYFCMLEALQNIQKYAHASHVSVQLREDDARITFSIIDDGCGFDVASMKRGAGLTNMADRLDALEGDLHIASSIGTGTTISGSLALVEKAVA
jgi:signal transduction histidine kinase